MNRLLFDYFMEFGGIWWDLTSPDVNITRLMDIDFVELFQDCYE